MNVIEKKRETKRKQVSLTKQKDTVIHKNASIDIIHSKKMQYFKDLQCTVLPEKITKNSTLKLQLQELNQQNESSVFINSKIQLLQSEIDDILSKKEETEYLLSTMSILKDYHEFTIHCNNTVKVFGKKQTETSLKKQEFLDLYLTAIKEPIQSTVTVKNNIVCTHCGTFDSIRDQKEHSVCLSCGTVHYVIISTNTDFKQRDSRSVTYVIDYKRLTYFKEALFQIQGNETIEIPQEVIDSVITELSKEKWSNLSKLSIEKTKSILKKTGNSKWYEHTPCIIKKINNENNIKIPPDAQEKLFYIFGIIEKEFNAHSFRSNFFSYPYCIHKMFELLELKEFYAYFPYLIDREKLHKQDEMWKTCILSVIKNEKTNMDPRFKIPWRFIKST